MATQENVKTAEGGVVYIAPIGSTAPSAGDDELGVDWVDLGYMANQGTAINPVPGDQVQVLAHNDDIVIQKTKKGNITFQFPFIELNDDVFEIYWDTQIGVDGSFSIEGGAANTEYMLVYDIYYSDETADRFFAPRVGIETRSAVANNTTSPVTFDITFGTRKDDAYDEQVLGWRGFEIGS